MGVRTLNSPPSVLPLYVRAAASLLPGASLLPFVPGRGSEVPDVELRLAAVRPDPEEVAAYAKVCGFALRDRLPATYPHVLAFPLHMAAMADGGFPFGAVGLVHVENRILQHRPIRLGEPLEIRVRTTKLEPHPRGRTFAFVSQAFVAGELVWEDVSRILHRGGGGDVASAPGTAAGHGSSASASASASAPAPQSGGRGDDERSGLGEGSGGMTTTEWRLPGDLGRRYASVSGDRNPIHMHALLAKPLGFPRAIAHGMWTKGRCLAALDDQLPDAFAVEVRFRKPILLPARVLFASAQHGEQIDFEVSDAKRRTPHLQGHARPLKAGEQTPADGQATGGQAPPDEQATGGAQHES